MYVSKKRKNFHNSDDSDESDLGIIPEGNEDSYSEPTETELLPHKKNHSISTTVNDVFAHDSTPWPTTNGIDSTDGTNRTETTATMFTKSEIELDELAMAAEMEP